MMSTKEGLRKRGEHHAAGEPLTAAPPVWLSQLTEKRFAAPLLSFSSSLLLWLSQPPFAWWPLGWIALVWWLLMAGSERAWWRRGYLWIYLSALAYWLITLQGLRHAHPAMFLGWFALSLYLAAYPPLAVALIRIARRYRITLPLAAAVVWTGLELIRSYAFTGFSANLLGHTQVENAIVVQVADTFGSYGVSFLLALVAGAIADGLLQTAKFRCRDWLGKAAFPAFLIAATLAYGAWRMQQWRQIEASGRPLGRIVLIQRNEAVEYIMPGERHQAIFKSYLQGSLEALQAIEGPAADLIVWPESMYSGGFPLMLTGEILTVPEGMSLSPDEFQKSVEVQTEIFRQQAAEIQRRLRLAADAPSPPAMLVGCGVLRFEEREKHFSGAVLIDAQSELASWYGKRHLVMFGEYIPFAHWMPWLYQVLPIGAGATPGPQAVSMEVADFTLTPNICFETVVEQSTIGQIRELTARGEPPQMVINITNDAWFGGSSLLDHHRRCSQMVAIGCRRPLLMASNIGPTVWIDGAGRIVRSLPKKSDGSILAEPLPDGRWAPYQSMGDWPARGLAACCVVLAGIGIGEARQRRHQRRKDRGEELPAEADS